MKIYTQKTVQMTDNIGEYLPMSESSFDYSGPLALADRSQQKVGKQAEGNESAVAGQAGANASQVGSSIIPGLEREANNPWGLTPTEKSNALTQGAEAVGGVNSGVTGAADLLGTRTKNTAGIPAALDEAARQKGRQLSNNALQVNSEDANLKNSNQKFAQGALGDIYGGDQKAQLSAMGLIPSTINSTVDAGKSGWYQNLLAGINTVGSAGKDAYGGAGGAGYARG